MNDKAKTRSIARAIKDAKWTLIQPGFLTTSFSLNR